MEWQHCSHNMLNCLVLEVLDNKVGHKVGSL